MYIKVDGNEHAGITKMTGQLALRTELTRPLHRPYIDFAKAFDSVCHSRLITKLRFCGISGDLLQWISDFCQVVPIELSSDIVYQMRGTFQVELFKAAA